MVANTEWYLGVILRRRRKVQLNELFLVCALEVHAPRAE